MWAEPLVAEHMWNTQDNLHLIFTQVSNLDICHPWEYAKWLMNSLLAWTWRLPRELYLQQHPTTQNLKNMCIKQAWLVDASLCISSWLLLLSLFSFPTIMSSFPEKSCLEISGVESCIWATMYSFCSNLLSFWVHWHFGLLNTLWQNFTVQLSTTWKTTSLYLQRAAW